MVEALAPDGADQPFDEGVGRISAIRGQPYLMIPMLPGARDVARLQDRYGYDTE